MGIASRLDRRCEKPKAVGHRLSLLGRYVQVDKTFGFETAVEEAQNALMAASVEAASGYRGVGLVKLMGRRSGFIAVQVRTRGRGCTACCPHWGVHCYPAKVPASVLWHCRPHWHRGWWMCV